jgi:phosphoribosylformylglycinamidine cyclo-ligase
MQALTRSGTVLAAAHITGGGLLGNLRRVIPESLSPSLTFDWPVPPIFARIQAAGGVTDEEMRAVFNLGIGIAMVAHPGDRALLGKSAERAGVELLDIGVLA